ncbi:RidA family protein [Cupriavidus sp. H19C3]|uniref:RidA family protein n=1 Tax=Cupriavidus sp. H19C3 TaxID=3241603 RepID=UPI003BF7A781
MENEFFPALRRVGQTVYVGLQLPVRATQPELAEATAIGEQTDHVFRSLVACLEAAGGSMADLTKLHTYYLFDGDGAAVTDYWERMTAVRLRHLANPGPAATALRVQGVGGGAGLIAVDGIAELGGDRQRIMPAHAWDWSMPTPFSQGWRVGHRIYVGGQISADRQGQALAPGEVEAQTENTLEYIEHVLRDAQAGWPEVTAIKIAYQHGADADASRRLGAQIVAGVARRCGAHKPAITMIGVNLLYEGLLLEIDAMASRTPGKPVWPAGSEAWQLAPQGFAPGWLAGAELHVGAQAAPGQDGFAAQLDGALARVAAVLAAAHATPRDLVKLNVFVAAGQPQDLADRVRAALRDFLVAGRTVLSIVEVAGFMAPGQRVQVDGLAILGQP